MSEKQINEFYIRKTITPIIHKVITVSKMYQKDVLESVRKKISIFSKVRSLPNVQILQVVQDHEDDA
jgi:hypothetical protein